MGQGVGFSFVALLYFTVEVLCYRPVVRLYELPHTSITRRIGATLLLVLFVGLDILAIRGGTTTAVANLSKAYFCDRMELNHAAVNPTFSLLSTLGEESDSAEYCFFDEAERERVLGEVKACKSGEFEQVLSSSRPDIVLIIAESFGCSTIFEHIGNEVVAPHFSALAKEGIYFENCYASSFRTDD